jgi:CBS domain-containing protein
MLASEIMTQNVKTMRPECSVQEAARLLSQERISGAPVLDPAGAIIGMLTEADIITHAGREGLCVADIMSREIITVDAKTPVHEIAQLLAERRIKRVPVVHEGKLVGIVSRADIVDAVARGYIIVRDW